MEVSSKPYVPIFRSFSPSCLLINYVLLVSNRNTTTGEVTCRHLEAGIGMTTSPSHSALSLPHKVASSATATLSPRIVIFMLQATCTWTTSSLLPWSLFLAEGYVNVTSSFFFFPQQNPLVKFIFLIAQNKELVLFKICLKLRSHEKIRYFSFKSHRLIFKHFTLVSVAICRRWCIFHLKEVYFSWCSILFKCWSL